ncbi:MAG: hypothetical protein J6T62_12500 [Fibrobacter sp.]|nr:hypothetical protein [Fibrobacter sp.]
MVPGLIGLNPLNSPIPSHNSFSGKSARFRMRKAWDGAAMMLFFLCPYEQQGIKTDNQQRDGKRQMRPLLAKENISEEKDNETCPYGITNGFIYFGIHSD